MELTVSAAGRMGYGERAVSLALPLIKLLERFGAPVLDLALRIWVGAVFFQAGLTKIQSWETTILLFENEYAVPLLPPVLAAYAGTFTELFFPVLLVLGFGARFAAAVLFVFNIVAVISYPDLSAAGRIQHEFWGLLLLVTLLHGPGKLSVDHLFRTRLLGRG